METVCFLWLSLPFPSGILLRTYYLSHVRKPMSAYAKTKRKISFAVAAKLFCAFAFATWIVQYLHFLHTKFQASSPLQWLYSLVYVRPEQNPHWWFSHDAAHLKTVQSGLPSFFNVFTALKGSYFCILSLVLVQNIQNI